MSDERGSGITKASFMTRLREGECSKHKEALRQIGMKGTQLERVADAYKRGMQDMLRHLVGMGIVIVLEDDPS